MPRCKKQIGGISDIVNTIISNINKARENDPVRKAQARYQRRIMTRQGEYEGGDFGGAGAGSEITYVPDYTYTNRNDTIYVPITRTFNDAFNEARKAGLSEFDFNGKRYTTEMGNNPNSTAAGNTRTETDILRFIRYNVDKNKINKDGSITRVGTNTRYGFKNGGIVSINGNVKNGLIYYSAPSPTGGLPDRSIMRCGGRKKAKLGDWFKENADVAEELNDNIADWLKQRRNNIRNIYNKSKNTLEDLSEILFNDKLTNDSPEVKRTNQRLKNAGRNLKRIGKSSIPGIVAEELIRRGYNEAQQMVNNGQGVYDSSADARDSQGNNPALGIYNLELPGVDVSNAGYNIPNVTRSANLDYTNYYPNTTGTGMLTLPRINNNIQRRAIEAGRVALRGNALEDARPQYYAERRLPLFEDGAAIQNGLVRAGWSHGNSQPRVSVNIPTMNVNLDDYFANTPRRGGGNGTSSALTSTGLPNVRQSLPAVTRPRTSLAVEANLDPGKVPASVVQAAHRQAANARQYGEYSGVTPRDWMSLAGNVAGSIGNWLATRNSPRITIAEPNRPFIEMPVRLKTNYNNRPQIANVEEQARRNYQNIRENTASSSAALARMQRVRNVATQNINELEAQRENIETQLTNADRANRQQVRARNARAMNQYYEDLVSARTRQSIADAQRKSANQAALSNLFNNVNLSFQDFLGRMDRRESFNNTLAYLRAANPNYDDRMFKDNGANFINMYLQGLNELVRK